jgi:hypothetical protein
MVATVATPRLARPRVATVAWVAPTPVQQAATAAPANLVSPKQAMVARAACLETAARTRFAADRAGTAMAEMVATQ